MKIRSYVAVAAVAVLVAPTVAWAGKLTCLTGTDPSVADDLTEIATVRDVIDAQCSCASFDGSKGKSHVRYVSCVNAVLVTEVSAGTVRSQCKATVKKYYSVSTCGVPASKGKAPCIKTSATGKVTCAIKPATKCTDAGKVACPNFALCIDAADTNGDGIIGAGDSGACNAADNPTNTPTTSPTLTPTKTSTRAPTATPLSTPTNTPTPTATPIPTATSPRRRHTASRHHRRRRRYRQPQTRSPRRQRSPSARPRRSRRRRVRASATTATARSLTPARG